MSVKDDVYFGFQDEAIRKVLDIRSWKMMSLFPEENISTREIESWKAFADSLKSEEKTISWNVTEMSEICCSNKCQRETIPDRTFDYGPFVGTT